LTFEEFKKKVGGTMPEDCLQSGANSSMTADNIKSILAANGDDSIDWRTKGAVTPVKNQGQYGTCWSFGATGTMEGMSVVSGKLPLESVSEQELIDCSPCGGYVGCCLSWYTTKTNGQPNTESSYPYKGRSGTCRKDSATVAKMKISKRICEANGDNNNQDNVLALLIKYGPGSCLVDASCIEGYHSGIISNCPKKAGDIDHATLFVGAGTDGGKPYWIVKNSWGTSFGDNGYYKMERNTNPPQAGVPGGIFGVSA
jgi:C1A family cysteine protease